MIWIELLLDIIIGLKDSSFVLVCGRSPSFYPKFTTVLVYDLRAYLFWNFKKNYWLPNSITFFAVDEGRLVLQQLDNSPINSYWVF